MTLVSGRLARPVLALATALLATACSGEGGSRGAFESRDLTEVIRGEMDAPEGLTVDRARGLTLADVAEEIESAKRLGLPTGDFSPQRLRELGWIAGREAHFSGDGSAAAENAYLFRDIVGAKAFIDLFEDVIEERIDAGWAKRLDARGLGVDAFGIENKGRGGEGYTWRIDNLVLGVIAVGSIDQKAFAEELDERAQNSR